MFFADSGYCGGLDDTNSGGSSASLRSIRSGAVSSSADLNPVCFGGVCGDSFGASAIESGGVLSVESCGDSFGLGSSRKSPESFSSAISAKRVSG